MVDVKMVSLTLSFIHECFQISWDVTFAMFRVEVRFVRFWIAHLRFADLSKGTLTTDTPKVGLCKLEIEILEKAKTHKKDVFGLKM